MKPIYSLVINKGETIIAKEYVKLFSMISHQGNVNQSHKQCHFSSVGIALIKGQKITRWDKIWENQTLPMVFRECEMMQLLWKAVGQPCKVTKGLPYHPLIPLLTKYSGDVKSHNYRKPCRLMFTAAFIPSAKRCPAHGAHIHGKIIWFQAQKTDVLICEVT